MRRAIFAILTLLLAALLFGWWRAGQEEAAAVLSGEKLRRQKAPKAVVTRQSAPPVEREPEEVRPAPHGELTRSLAGERPEEELGYVRFRVETESGQEVARWFVSSEDCGLFWTSGLPNTVLPVSAGPCTFQAFRQDGALTSRSRVVSAEIQAGETEEVALRLPDARTGGLGVQIEEHELGMQVVRVFPGTPAAELGLVAGDLIVEVDGELAAEMELQEFIETLTGPEGSEVDFSMAWEGDTGLVYEDVTLVRTYLEGSGSTGPFRGAELAERALEALQERDR